MYLRDDYIVSIYSFLYFAPCLDICKEKFGNLFPFPLKRKNVGKSELEVNKRLDIRTFHLHDDKDDNGNGNS